MRKRYTFLSCWLLLIFLSGNLAFGQTRRVTGRVTSAQDGSTLPGVNVVVKGTTTGVSTDADGKYSINVPDDKNILTFSSIALVTQDVQVNNRSVINATMTEAVNELAQVVVTGYNSVQKKDITGSMVSVTSEKFKELPVTSFDQALQGQAAGVQVTQSSGTPGGGISVRVRGSTSISASNRPLFIVDGVPVEDGGLSSIGTGGQNDNAFALLNPNDIESMQILKDASAKAIYGSRAANGVVLITTKRGKNNEKTTITAEVQRGMTEIIRKPRLLNSSELLDLQREAVTNAGQDPDKFGLIKGVTDGVNTDWVDAVTRRGLYQQYQLSASGGTERTRFYISGNFRDEQGVLLANEFKRLSGTINLDHKATSKLSFGTNMTLARALNKRVLGDNTLNGVYSGAVNSLPYFSPYNEKGQILVPGDPNYSNRNYNPVGEALFPRQNVISVKLLGGIYAEYELLPNLRFRSKASIDYNSVIDDDYFPTTTWAGGISEGVGGQGLGLYTASVAATFINTNTLTYNGLFGEKHRLSVMLGHEVINRTDRSSFVQGRLFTSDDFTYIGSAGVVDQGSSSLGNSGLLSFFGEARYDFKERYLFTLTSRYDGSSRFGSDRRFGFFPSASAAWRISSEKFMEQFRDLSDLKLRASFGYTGNERIGDFQFLGTWGATTYSGASGLGPSSVPNPFLQWERTREANLGVDVSFFNGRLTFSVDAYNNLTDKLLFAQPIPLTTGFGAVQGNIGKVSNKGAELSVSTVNMDKGFRWTTDLNLSHNENKVVELDTPEPLYRGYQASGATATNIILPGQPLGTFWGLKFLGVDPATGDAIYDDKNGDGRITPDDAQVIGNAQAKLFGGMTNKLSWKGFDLSVFFQFSYGNKVLNLTKNGTVNAGESLEFNQSKDALKRWQKPGDITSVPRYEFENTYNNYHSSRFLEDGSYLRLKNVTLGYNVNKKWVTRVKVTSARVYVSATNIWTYTKYSGSDPEVSTLDGSTSAQGIELNTLPQIKTGMVGLSVTF
jgi:TonB-linked SusC/RagA family outer membrane protein